MEYSLGNLYIGVGPMFAGKTLWLTERLNREADFRDLSPKIRDDGTKVNHCVIINSIKDDRVTASSSNDITTHSSRFAPLPKIDFIKANRLVDTLEEVDKYSVIGIDEGQFFEDLDEIVFDLILKKGKTVYVAALESDFNLKEFGKVHKLYGLCPGSHRTYLTARCTRCQEVHGKLHVEASCSYRMVKTKLQMREEGGVGVGEGEEQIDIGGADKYMAVCMQCYHELTFSPSK